MASEKYKLILLKKSLIAWKKVGPELSQKNSLYKILDRERKMKLGRRFIRGMKMYHEYRVNKQTTDHFMTKAIHMIKAKGYLKKWHSLLSKRTGLQLLDYVFVKSRQREFYKRTARKGLFE
jgi:hypothetical protein